MAGETIKEASLAGSRRLHIAVLQAAATLARMSYDYDDDETSEALRGQAVELRELLDAHSEEE